MSSIAWSLMLLAAHITAPAATARPPLRAAIVLDVDPRLPPVIQRLAVDEAARVWAPYRVAVTLRKTPTAGSSEPEGTVVSVRLAGLAPRAAAWSSPFGSIRFVDGRPEPVVLLHYEGIGRAIAGSGAMGLRQEQWPAGMRDRILGRIVGRVLAHEIGHFVLRSPRHTSRGLMRPIQSITEPIAGTGEVFGLTPQDLDLLRSAIRLQGVVAAGNAPTPLASSTAPGGTAPR
jgi:hypothetical protein